ncbi:hypothetical protein J2S36_001337 [Arcanobacterium hippocoleae]|uniref:DUF3644 domain-containing protein n=2 Tax=Arcanobacterium hippocoleae TaxID=149017 RepID=A0ABU1T355_9ACTO|nr:DUF3644 domain-containing protein [Arcanobacterium hippocoleae]MDR6939794.1 hypothetical protein [Arcanobacterium hippocoleae]
MDSLGEESQIPPEWDEKIAKTRHDMNTSEQKALYERLLNKSQELFTLAVELYNRPTIRYHAEGCAIFLCSAWELMLKATILQRDGNAALYYKNSSRTLSLEDCLKKVFTNEKDPLRKNMDKIVDLRNTSTQEKY